MSQIKRFQIIGLKNYRNVNVIFKEPYKILVGENGLGKTTILDVFYYLLTRKWGSMDEIVFDFIELELESELIEFSQSELHIYVEYLEETKNYTDKCIIGKFENIELTLDNLFKNRVVYFPIFRNIHQQLSPLLSYKYRNDLSSFLNRKLFDKETKEILRETVMEFNMNSLKEMFLENIGTDNLVSFKEICNAYLEETRFMNSDQTGLEIINTNNNEKIDLQYLSSGEKQIINIFSKFYFSKRNDLILLIDEPEMSLSIAWQSKLLPDIISSQNCSFLFAITHSPFIFSNDLTKYAEGLDIYISKRPNA